MQVGIESRLDWVLYKNPEDVFLKNWKGELGGGFKHFVMFTPTSAKIPNLTNIFQMGWFNHQLENSVEDAVLCKGGR